MILDFYFFPVTGFVKERDNIEELALFLAQTVMKSLQLAIKIAKGDKIEEEDFEEKLQALNAKLKNIREE